MERTKTASVKIEVELPKNVHDALKLICLTFDQDGNDFIVRALIDDIESTGDSLFAGYIDDFREKVMKILRGENND